MLEILALIFGTRHLAGVLRQKGRSVVLCALFPVAWILSEIVAIIVALILLGDEGLGLICCGFLGGAVGGGIVFAILNALPSKVQLD
ncbi:MAG: hypothetical protein EA397_14885 [Deltaproteobacteria bacterium]|nr:MAG: hypothetical protein EA397_14885 [Deltaproteobacteria bacterium]